MPTRTVIEETARLTGARRILPDRNDDTRWPLKPLAAGSAIIYVGQGSLVELDSVLKHCESQLDALSNQQRDRREPPQFCNAIHVRL